MKEFIKSLKLQNNVDLAKLRVYETNTPSATGLLSLIDWYEFVKNKNSDAAAKRWTLVHSFMEDMLTPWRSLNMMNISEYAKAVCPYIYLLKRKNIELEKKIVVKWVVCWTIDYISTSEDGVDVTDFKTTSKLYSVKWTMLDKYSLQLGIYSLLVEEGNADELIINKNLFFISPTGCSWAKAWETDNKPLTLILYYHILNWTIETAEVKEFFKNKINELRDIRISCNSLRLKAALLIKEGIDTLL